MLRVSRVESEKLLLCDRCGGLRDDSLLLIGNSHTYPASRTFGWPLEH